MQEVQKTKCSNHLNFAYINIIHKDPDKENLDSKTSKDFSKQIKPSSVNLNIYK